jgi:small subunit ribosomal protein S2
MSTIEKNLEEGVYDNLSKRERLHIVKQKDKLEKNFGSIANMNRVPSAIFIVDVLKEHIAVREAQKLNIPIFATVDTNSDPRGIDFPIPANDDASKSISLIVDIMANAIQEGLDERKMEKEKEEKSEKGKKKEPQKTEGATEEAESEEKEKPKKTRERKATAAKKKAPVSKEKPTADKDEKIKSSEVEAPKEKATKDSDQDASQKQKEEPKTSDETQKNENKEQVNN